MGNDIENVPLAFIVFMITKSVILEANSRLALCILIPLYTFFRFIHFFAMVNDIKPPFRSLPFLFLNELEFIDIWNKWKICY